MTDLCCCGPLNWFKRSDQIKASTEVEHRFFGVAGARINGGGSCNWKEVWRPRVSVAFAAPPALIVV